MEDEMEYEPSIRNILEQEELKWIFVGGKGGVGKTSVSCSLAIQLARIRKSVLLISTDPAHNISDSFEQQFTRTPCLVNGFDNLMAMEVDSKPSDEGIDQIFEDPNAESADFLRNVMTNLMGNLPGIDELISLTKIVRITETQHFDTVIFDTAPTGHTLRLLSIPTSFQNILRQLIQMKSFVGGFVNTMTNSFGIDTSEMNLDRIEMMLPILEKLNNELKNPDMTTFVCVCIPEFLSLFETERLIQKLTELDIDTHNVVVNQIVYPDRNKDGVPTCGLCGARSKMQLKYLDQISDLYEDFNVTRMPLLPQEVKGVKMLKKYGALLKTPANMNECSVHDLVKDE